MRKNKKVESKFPLSDILSAIDQGGKDIWDMLDDDQKKEVNFFTLNRFISSVKTSNRQAQEHFVLATNEYYNKNYFLLTKHPKLLWQLLCMCSFENKQEYFHEYIKVKKDESAKLRFLSEIYPTRKMKDLELLADISSVKELKQLAIDAGWDDKSIAKFF